MKNKGFTLVELLAVIVLLGLLMAIAVPSALQLSSSVKNKAYKAKIDQIEQAAVNYGQANLSLVRQGANFNDTSSTTYCTFTFNSNKEVTNVDVANKTYSESISLGTNQYWCSRITVKELVQSRNLNWDKEGQCSTCSSDDQNYNSVVINPSDDYIINQCYIYLYYRNSRVYAYFDKTNCDKSSDTVEAGREYKPKN